MALDRVDALLLDSFGTLVSMEPPGPRLRSALARADVHVSAERAAAAFRAEIAYYVAHHLDGRNERSLHELRARCAEVLRAALGEDGRGLSLDVAREAMLDAIRFEAYPEAAAVLAELRARGLRLVVASNWDCSLPRVLERAGLAQLVDGVVTSAVVGAAKPDPALFEAALAVAGCPPERALHVGDSVDKDVAGAAAAGIRAVLIDRGGGGAAPDGRAAARIETLAGLARVI